MYIILTLIHIVLQYTYIYINMYNNSSTSQVTIGNHNYTLLESTI